MNQAAAEFQQRTGIPAHKEKAYPGAHAAIVGQDLWKEVQAILAANTNGERRGGTRRPSLLTGLVVDEHGEGLTPSHAVKKGRRYHYYVSRHLITEGNKAGRRGWRIPAADLEALVVARLRGWLSDATAVSEIIEDDPRDVSAHAALITSAKVIAERWSHLAPDEAKTYLNACIRRVVIRPDSLTLEIDGAHARETLLASPVSLPAKTPRGGDTPADNPITIHIPVALKRVGTGMKLVVPGTRQDAKPDPSLIRLLLRAFAIQDRLVQNPQLTLQQIAEAEGVSPSYVTRLLRLSYLAPDMVAAIIDGHQPLELTANKLMGDTRLPLEWPAQRARLGFSAT